MKNLPTAEARKHAAETYPVEMNILPEKFVRKAEEELNETKETQENGLKQMKEMIQSDKNMIGIVFSDDYLIQYLRGRKYNIQKAYHVLKKMVSFAKKYKTYFSPMTAGKFDIVISEKPLTVLPKRDKDGCVIVHIKLNKWDPSEIHVDDVIRYVILFLTYILHDPMTQVNGLKVLFDFKCNPLKYIRFCTPFYLFLIYHGTQECLPARFKAIHIVNPTLIFKTAWPIISPFLPEKLKKRVIVHESVPKLQNFFHESLIPVEYGGELKDYDFAPFMENSKLPDCIKYILRDEPKSSK